LIRRSHCRTGWRAHARVAREVRDGEVEVALREQVVKRRMTGESPKYSMKMDGLAMLGGRRANI